MSLIELTDVTKTYHVGEIDVPVLKGVSFSIERGELVALMGASGSGKSTLMNILGCLDRPTSGSYKLDGRDVSQLPPNDRALVRTSKLGFVFQSFNLLARTSALHNVLMPLDYAPEPVSQAAAIMRAEKLLARVGLTDRSEHVPAQMSGGQQQRVAIARSLINEPALILADEPTGNLDSRTSVEILEMFQQLNALGMTIVLVTHDPKVAGYADRVIRVVDGLIVEDERLDDAPPTTLASASSPSAVSHPTATNGHAGHNGSSNGTSNGYANGHADHGEPAAGWAESAHVAGPGTATLAPAAKRRLAPAAPGPAPVEAAETAVEVHPVPTVWIPTSLRTAIGALRRNKMRSALTTLGIVIGVGAVIAMVEISQGSRTSLMQAMSTMGANNIMIRSGAAASGGISFGQGSMMTLSPDDAEEIGRAAPAVAACAPVVQIQGSQVVRDNRNWVPMNAIGTTPDYLVIRDWQTLSEGEMFTTADVRNANKVCVIGQTLAKQLFDGDSPIGEDIRLKNVTLRIVGVLSRKGANMMGMDQDDTLLAPWTTMKYRISSNGPDGGAAAAASAAGGAATVNSLNKLYPAATPVYPVMSPTQAANTPQPVRFANVNQIMIKAVSTPQIQESIDQITEILRRRHHLRDGEPDDFQVRDMTEVVNTMGSMSNMMGALLLIVALISLVVGGVGIMNIMLVSVTERTREIGLRMAVGARSYHILRQFLIESVVLCLFGGALGILLGRGASTAVWYSLRWPIAASWPAIAGAFGVSAAIGIAFGFYPAWKASRLDPIDALRYE